ncbi:hypothetical protein FOZ62_002092, partial [Perkinsus olseni]
TAGLPPPPQQPADVLPDGQRPELPEPPHGSHPQENAQVRAGVGSFPAPSKEEPEEDSGVAEALLKEFERKFKVQEHVRKMNASTLPTIGLAASGWRQAQDEDRSELRIECLREALDGALPPKSRLADGVSLSVGEAPSVLEGTAVRNGMEITLCMFQLEAFPSTDGVQQRTIPPDSVPTVGLHHCTFTDIRGAAIVVAVHIRSPLAADQTDSSDKDSVYEFNLSTLM